MKRAVIFDMDGVIFDSEKATYLCWKELSGKYGIENLDEVYKKVIGVNIQKSREIFLDFYGEDFPFDFYREEESKVYHSRYDGGKLPLKPGIRELLAYLKENKYLTAVASSTRTEVVTQQIIDAGLMDYFDYIIGGDQVVNSKPDPEIFLTAAKKLGAEPCEAYVIEDSFNGIRAARSAKMTAVMVPDMLEPDDEMREKTDYILPDLFAVIKLIDNE